MKRALIAFLCVLLVLSLADYGTHYFGLGRFAFVHSQHKLIDLWTLFNRDVVWLFGGAFLCAAVIYMRDRKQNTAFRSAIPNDAITDSKTNMFIPCTLFAVVASVLLTLILLVIRPPEGNGWISQGGAEIFGAVGLLAFFFPVCWIPSLVIGFLLERKTFTKSQRHTHYFVMAILALVFVVVVTFIIGIIIHRR